jgi:hypothetical protein
MQMGGAMSRQAPSASPMPSAVTGWLDRLVRWYWIRRTGADPVIILNHLRAMEALNSLHEKFLDRLGAKYPKLEQEIREHRSQCFDAINPPNAEVSDGV